MRHHACPCLFIGLGTGLGLHAKVTSTMDWTSSLTLMYTHRPTCKDRTDYHGPTIFHQPSKPTGNLWQRKAPPRLTKKPLSQDLPLWATFYLCCFLPPVPASPQQSACPCPPSLHCHHTHYPMAQALSWRSGIGLNENIWHNCATCTGLTIHWGERDRESLHLFQE